MWSKMDMSLNAKHRQTTGLFGGMIYLPFIDRKQEAIRGLSCHAYGR